MQPLISIIIPCYNAEKWIQEAIESALGQKYNPLEVIVIDDGSTDTSLDIIKKYGDRITWRTGANRGGNHARNLGFSLSAGKYIQYLDADDYLHPEKIQHQVEYLQRTSADVVYGDWQHQHHYPNGKVELGKVEVSGYHQDILAALLSGWWVSPACILFDRSTVEAIGGWDESLTSGQDKDFFLAAAVSGAKVEYQPGCYSVYRRYGDCTVSTSSKERHLENRIRILEKHKHELISQGRLTPVYKEATAQFLFQTARSYLDLDRSKYKTYLEAALELSPEFRPKGSNRTISYKVLERVFGFAIAEKIVVSAKSFKRRVKK